MVEIIGVKFNGAGKIYYFSPQKLQLEAGEMVLVETAHGLEMAKVVVPNKMVEEKEIVAPLKSVVRVATQDDFRQIEENKEKGKEAFAIAAQKIAEHNLDMKLVEAEYTFDRSKILFYFTHDGRVDFRDLVKSLAGVFRTRIELRQIGVRDEARQLGSLGICGRFLCCSTFLDDFKPVSIKMAKEQGLSLNPTKISGVCGRLMCCLQYEEDAYGDMLKKMPHKGEKVETPDGIGVVADTGTLKGLVKVRFFDQNGEPGKTENYYLNREGQLGKNGKPILVREEDYKKQREAEQAVEIPPAIPVPVAEPKTKDESPVSVEETEKSKEEARPVVKKGGGEEKKLGSRPIRRRNRRLRNGKNGGVKPEAKKEQKPTQSSGNGGYSNGYDPT